MIGEFRIVVLLGSPVILGQQHHSLRTFRIVAASSVVDWNGRSINWFRTAGIKFIEHLGRNMTIGEILFLTVALLLIILVLGNLVFSRVAEHRNPPVGMFVECDGVRLHYIARGDPAAPSVVLFHGNGSMLQDFMISGLVDRLVETHRVICFDRPGFGHSQRPRFRIWNATSQAALFAKALNQLGIRDPVVLGHSWGTLVAIALSLRSDYPIRGLVLASGYYFLTWRWDVWLMSGPAIPVVGDLVSYTVAPLLSWAILPLAFRKIFAPRSAPQKFKNQFPAALALRPKQLRAAAEESALLIPTAAEFQGLYQNIACQVRIVHGSEDQVIEPRQAQDLHQALRRSDLRLVPNAGHMVTYADTDAVAAAVTLIDDRVSWLRSVV
jgi:pimeloyl-ACP methyl ester carboxylesterase